MFYIVSLEYIIRNVLFASSSFLPYSTTTVEPMRAQTLCLLSAKGQVCTHVWVEEEVYNRRGLGEGKGEEEGEREWEGRKILLGTFTPDCRHEWLSKKNK